MKHSDPYKTLFVGRLVQRTALSIGGNSPNNIVDSPLARDGLGRPTLRGTGLAGALIATANRRCGPLPAHISEGVSNDSSPADDAERMQESVWRMFTSHPTADGLDVDEDAWPATEFRAGVAISQRTGAAADKLRFDIETVPAGTQWWFCLEVDDYRDVEIALRAKSVPRATALAALALKEWEDGLCFVGRDVARGLGWMRLEGLQVYRLSANHIPHWPRAFSTPQAAVAQLPVTTRQNLDDLAELRASCDVRPSTVLRRGRGTVVVGTSGGMEYGLDSLSVAGAGLDDIDVRPPTERFVRPPDERLSAWQDSSDPDHLLAWTTRMDEDGEPSEEPFLPGSGIRGSLRHALSWWYRSRRDVDVADPIDPVKPNRKDADPNANADGSARADTDADTVATLFGNVERSAALLISDAHLVNDQYELALLEQHAEDEFTGSTFESAKFNRLCLLSGEFRFDFVVEADNEQILREHSTNISLLDGLGRQGFVPLGGANWRGQGWVELRLQFDDEGEQA